MQPEWRVVAVVDTTAGKDLIPLICSAEPHSYRCEQLECDRETRDRWQILVNFADGEQAAGRSAKALLRTAMLLAESHDTALEIRNGREWVDILVHQSTRSLDDAGAAESGGTHANPSDSEAPRREQIAG